MNGPGDRFLHTHELQLRVDAVLADLCRLDPLDGAYEAKMARAAADLRDVYANRAFRHASANILPILAAVEPPSWDDRELAAIDALLQRADSLTANLAEVRHLLANDAEQSVVRGVNRLLDDANLQLQNLSNLKDCFAAGEDVRLLSAQLDASAQEAEQVRRHLDDVEANLERSASEFQKHSVATLSVLAAVVLAFSGGVTYSVSSINAVNSSHPLNVALVVLLVGFVLFNVMAALFSFLRATVKRNDEKTWSKGQVAVFAVTDALMLALLVAAFFLALGSWVP